MLQNTFSRLTSQLKSSEVEDQDDRLHIIISGERGKVHRIPCSKKKLRTLAIIFTSIAFFLTFSFAVTLFFAINKDNTPTIAATSVEPDFIAPPQEQLGSKVSDRKVEQELKRLRNKIAALEGEKQEQYELFEQEKENVFSSAIEELAFRTELLDKIFRSVGVIVPKNTKIKLDETANSGGPFLEVSPVDRKRDELISRVDTYLKKVETIPLGRPATGAITSRYGKRHDPFNGRTSYHEGIDFRGRPGELIHATAEGVVTRAGRNGGYGKYVEIKHNGEYSTAFAHMRKILVKVGQKVKRGDVIGQIGNTGRSTGPHLHYEILVGKKAINPDKFIRAASIVKTLKADQKKLKR